MKQLLIFLKFPEPGKVKTRLAVSLGDERACEIYRSLVERTLKETSKLPTDIQKVILFDPPEREPEIKEWLGGLSLRGAQATKQSQEGLLRFARNDVAYIAQKGNGLGERLKNAFHHAFQEGASQVIVIGTDLPRLRCDHLLEAFNNLDSHNVVIGPAQDGGYYLLGLGSTQGTLFEGIPWSTNEVFQKTTEKIKNLDLTCFSLELLEDLDTIENMHLLKWM